MKTCEDCVHFGVKDDGYGSYERHDNYCYKFNKWLGFAPRACDEFEAYEEDDEPELSNDYVPEPTEFVDKYGHKFKVVGNSWPSGAFVWNIGRRNFPHEGYLPLTYETSEKYHIDTTRLYAFKVGNEELCLRVLKEASLGKRGYITEDIYRKIRHEWNAERTENLK